MDLVCPSCVVLDRAGNLTQVIVQRDRVRFAIVPSLDRRQSLLVFLNQLGKLVEDVSAGIAVYVAPFGALEGLSRCCYSIIYILGAGCVD